MDLTVILICIALITKDAKLFFLLLVIWISSGEESVQIFCLFFFRVLT